MTLRVKGESGDGSLEEEVEAIRAAAGVPALGGGIIGPEGAGTLVVAGVRKAGSSVRATTRDRWHIGSNTKAMTATLAGMLVEEGKLSWSATLGDLLPRDCRRCAPGVRLITLTQLLTHRSGLPANLPDWWKIGGRERDRILRAAAPSGGADITPGEKYVYSNVGYAVAGRVIESITGKSWEDVMRTRLFRPLGMEESGFGPAGKPHDIDQPWPHSGDGRPLRDKGPHADNAPSLGPAGRVHCTLADYARFAALHLGASGDGRPLVGAETLTILHTPPSGGDYAGGWVIAERDWGGGRVLNHAGSNTVNHFVAWLAPARRFGVMACCNQAGRSAESACDRVCNLLISKKLTR